jgi:hypothetical protein
VGSVGVKLRELVRDLPPVSCVGLDIGAMRAQRPPGSDALTVGLVKRSFDLGMTLLDLSSGGDPAGNRELAVRALEGRFRTAITLVAAPGLPGDDPPANVGSVPMIPAVRASSLPGADESIREAATLVMVPGRRSDAGRRSGPPSNSPRRSRDEPLAPGRWGLDLANGPPPAQSLTEGVRRGATLFRFEANLLELDTWRSVEAAGEPSAVPRVIANPHAGGRLDGSFLEEGGLARIPPRGPPDWKVLREQMLPVTSLGFLTADRRRPLVVAAVQALLEAPTVRSVVVAPRSLSALELLATPEKWVPFDEQERRELERWFAA